MDRAALVENYLAALRGQFETVFAEKLHADLTPDGGIYLFIPAAAGLKTHASISANGQHVQWGLSLLRMGPRTPIAEYTAASEQAAANIPAITFIAWSVGAFLQALDISEK